jgi:NhaP-type Na+/H+ or K+/H+ antiporter
MVKFLLRLKTLILFVLSIILFWQGFTLLLPSLLWNMLIIIAAVFILMLACDSFDKNNKLGKYNKS